MHVCLRNSRFTRREFCRMAAAGTLFGWSAGDWDTHCLADDGKRPFSINYILASSMYGTTRLIKDIGPKLLHFYAWQHGCGCHKKLPNWTAPLTARKATQPVCSKAFAANC